MNTRDLLSDVTEKNLSVRDSRAIEQVCKKFDGEDKTFTFSIRCHG